MKNNILVAAAVAAMCAIPCVAGSAENHPCSGIYADAQRLACYDGAFGKPARPAGGAPTATPAPALPAAPAAAAPQPAASAKDQPVSAQIVAVGKLSGERFALTLDNGQVWMQLERDPNAQVRVGDAVKIRPAMLGSWMLETRDGVKTRVRLAR